jgi:FSR family fosmidomycin resistance protein-like MFS transporter
MNDLTKDRVIVWCYAVVHGLIDLASSFVVYNTAIVHNIPPAQAAGLTILYDLIAFGIQPLVGLLIDYVKAARTAMLIGIVLTLTGVVLMHVNALTGIVLVGVGNALFHVGAGGQILGRYPGKASTIGIFVGPGALGLSIGLWFGSRFFFPFWFLVIGLVVAYVGLFFLPALKVIPIPTRVAPCQVKIRPFMVFLLFVAIAIRGFVGRTGFAGIQADAFVIIGLGAAACIGKMVGGAVADRFGWGRTAIVALLLAGIGLVFVPKYIGVAFAVMILFQMTMPITLAATSAALPGKPAFAFGLTCLALLCGTLPAYYLPLVHTQLLFSLAMIGISSVCIIAALRQMGYMRPQGDCRNKSLLVDSIEKNNQTRKNKYLSARGVVCR